MPIFKYNCKQCSSDFESLTKYEQTEPVPCVACGSPDTQREEFPTKAPGWSINGASAANNYGLKPDGRNSRGRKLY
jgi:putative FmdB family regulatory protein